MHTHLLTINFKIIQPLFFEAFLHTFLSAGFETGSISNYSLHIQRIHQINLTAHIHIASKDLRRSETSKITSIQKGSRVRNSGHYSCSILFISAQEIPKDMLQRAAAAAFIRRLFMCRS
ncbi:hypothetical protein CDAR_16151 [Caerostris darwini]|uniref:Uncharacterized protein n=1 Tax=Caerostris darwini TaxID=1538125 RepID=A0AAV4USD3_9ARAC|nr:hypothetical protein CDAR_16151 [Caerostris darwini]